MEHPFLFLPKLFELFGLGHFAAAYPHVVYSWLVLLILIVLAYFGARKITLVPGKAQNFFEVVVSGMEEFMVDVTGEEGRWFFPLVGSIFLYIVTCNLIGLIPGFFLWNRKRLLK
jgi:F-type H+-transporting ATPase subunit a